ncbi:MAG: right-handed parallel beta-helix repeat-containing protein [Planctomycetota bacterium]
MSHRAILDPLAVAVVVAFSLITGCERGSSPPPDVEPQESAGSDVGGRPMDEAAPPLAPGPSARAPESPAPSAEEGAAPVFDGITGLLAGATSFDLRWRPARDDHDPPEAIRYRVYTSKRPGDQDFSAPRVTTAPGVPGTRIDGLLPGVALYVVVRALDGAGNEDRNEVEWRGIPNPVLYVNPSAPSGGDGRTPESPFGTIGDAIGEAIGMEGANFYLASGVYRESVFLFDGMMLYGGFTEDFDPALRNPGFRRTKLQPEGDGDLVVLAPGKQISGLDGVFLDGAERAARGVVADDCSLRISNCEVTGFLRKGIHLKSDDDGLSIIEGTIRGCGIHGNRGEGIGLEGIFDLEFGACTLRGNTQEGIDADPMVVMGKHKSRLKVEDCDITGNGGIGIRVDIQAPPGGRNRDGRIRISIRGNQILRNNDYGVSIDIRYPEETPIDLRARIEGNRIAANGKGGIHLDGDAPGDFPITSNAIVGNRGRAGILLTGDSGLALYRLQNNRLTGNQGEGVRLTGPGTVLLKQTHLRRNRGAAIHAPSGWVRLSGCILESNDGAFDGDLIDHSLLDGDEPAQRIEQGAGMMSGPVRSVARPREILFLGSSPRGAPLALAPGHGIEVGETVEWGDDGVARRVTAVHEKTLVVEPAPEGAVGEGDLLLLWGGETSVRENGAALADSPHRDAGDDLERDHDGTRADIGTAGGYLGGEPGPRGPGRGLPRILEPVRIDPPPGSCVVNPRWEIRFNGEIPETLPVRLFAGEKKARLKARRAAGRSLVLEAKGNLRPGTPLRLEMLPWIPGGGVRPQPFHLLFEYLAAAPLPEAGEVITRLPVWGVHRLAAGEGSRRYRIRLPEGGSLRATLEGRSSADRLTPAADGGASLVLYASDGKTVLLRSTSPEEGSREHRLGPYASANAEELVLAVTWTPARAGEDLYYRLKLTP